MTTTASVPIAVRPAPRGRLLGSYVIDSLGSGLFLAFTVVYFVRTTGLSLAEVGAAISLGRLLAAPTALCVGPLIDRYDARRVALSANLLSAVAYLCFLAAGQLWQVAAVVFLAQVGAASYWTASTGLVVLAAEPAERPRLFALASTLRNAGLALGGALGAVLLGWGGADGLRVTVAGNAASYAVAALLLLCWRPVGRAAATARPTGGYGLVLRDRRYLRLIAVNLCFVFASLVLSLLLAAYLVEGLHRAAWVAGSLLVLNTAQVVLTQTAVTRLLTRYRPTRVVAAGSLLNAAAFGLFALLGAAPGWAVTAGLYAAMLLYNAAETVATPHREELSVALADPALRGRYLAVYQLSWTFGQTVGPGLLTALLGLGAAWPWLFLLGLSLAAVPLVLGLDGAGPRALRPSGAPAGTR
ncbi:MFS transporter [Kitasatospora sp. MMS16-BH015]|uniref:MFS transporter n=1 Tax=Kitasatospora sp. MMS16-BH015 TaxID=2018025 RepID=UPI000CA23E24|nr:MFS transporter [Kitasatospora sp. MMS16-BH015]AUG76624.1 MFS transporter [Kitasatospora sp. MMS16-BH015]